MKRQNKKAPGSRIAQLKKELTVNAVELKRINRDLEIEASLERVRVVAMGMNQSDDLLSICETMFHELKKLVFEDLRNAMIDIHYEAKGYLLNYDYSENAGKAITTFKYGSHPIVDNLIYHAKQSSETFTEMVYSGTALDELRIFRKQNGEADDARLDTIEALYYYFYSIGTGAIGISTFNVAKPEQLDVLKRFRNVFDLAYKRYIDITNAEAQAREAQIELGLERVRARTMAMQQSDELVDAAAILFKQVKDLSVGVWTCGFQIWKPGEPGTTVAYMTLPDGTIRVPFDIPHAPEPFLSRAYEAAERGDQFYVEEIGGDALAAHYKYMLALPGASDRMVDISAGGFHLPEFQVNHNAYFSQGALLFITYEPVPQSWDIFKRFAKVFEQTYTRFLDLKKAEGQAREALIEAALERVRSRAMAMHKTDELREAAELLAKELTGLGIERITVCYVLVNEKDKTGAYYGVNPIDSKIPAQPTIMPHTETKVMRALRASWLKQEPVHFIALDPKASIAHQTYIGKLIASAFAAQGVAPEFTVEGFLAVSPERVHLYSLNFKQGYLFVVGGAPLAAADVDILTRFTKVFELTYTRFLDIQKAEAQAREGKIELALERVRARTMAMQHSDELAETAYILFQQFREMGENPDQATIGIINEAERVIEYWVTIDGNQTDRVFKFPVDEPNVTRKIYYAWKAQEKSLVIDLCGKALRDFSKFRASMGGAGYNPDEKRRIINVAFFSKGLINVQSTVARAAESLRLLERFANVFEGTYTRFLDLKKAEAQAREAQIELALERVRARAMAMRDSTELSGMVSTVFGELTKLDFALTRCAIVIADASSAGRMIWMANSEAGQPPISFYRKSLDHPYPNAANEEWKKRTPKWVYHLKGAEKKAMDDYYANSEEVAHMPSVIRRAMDMPESIILSHSFNDFGYLRADSLEPLSEVNLDILYRFAKVFDLGYTRFTDIRQAEAQAREAQIELALERVRAKTMAMQKSDELAETVSLLFKQLLGLGIRTEQIRTCGIVTFDDKKPMGEQWITETNGEIIPQSFMVPYDEAPAYKAIYKSWKDGEKFMVIHLEGEKLKEHLGYLAQGTNVPTRDVVLPQQATEIYNHVMFFSQGCLFIITKEALPEYHEVFKRFGAVFQQSYTRFLDLQKAEAQARESQIEAALERVRSRTMAMQKSDELKEVIQLIYEQLKQLNFNIDSANFALDYKESDDFNLWLSSAGQLYPTKVHIPYIDIPIFNRFIESKKNGVDFLTENYSFEEKNAFFDHFFKNVQGVTDERKEFVMGTAGYARSTVMMKNVTLSMQNYAAIPYSVEDNAALRRFGKVFEQTYTRFLDLQQAEEQVREAQVQLALERVRARTMAMHQSIELAETSEVLFQQFAGLGIGPERVVIGTMIENPRKIDLWGTEQGGNKMGVRFELREDWTVWFDKVYNAWEDKKKNLTIVLKDKDLDHHVHYMRDVIGMPMQLELIHQQRVLYAAFFTKGFLMMVANEAEPKETLDILERFAGVFNLTYTRFLDLQKAEEQAREARIETSLERVRSKAMAMRSSEDLADAIGVFYHELGLLSVTPKRCGMGLIDKETRITEISTMNTTEQGDSVEVIGSISLTNHPVLAGIYDNWLLQKEYHPILRGNEIKAYYQLLRPQISYPDYPHDVVQYGYFFFFQDGGVFAWTDTALPEDELQIYRRFNSVLSLTYRRYKDIKDAEAQARESQIQLALERIRARTMAMQKSDELAETAMTLFQQFNELGVKPERIFIGNMDENARTIEFWGTDQGGNQMNPRFEVNADATIGFSQIYKAWKTKKKTHTVIMKGRELADHVRYVQNVLHMPMQPELVRQQRIMYSAFFSKGLLMIVTPEIQSNETIGILERFAGVFDGTYTRFLDLQKAEAQARESQIQLALERVRARTMAMHTSEDVGDTVATMFDELVKLGVEKTVRSGIAIIESAAHMELWTASSNPNEEIALTRGHVNVTIHPLLQGFYNAWKNKEQHFSYELAGDDLKEYYLAMNNSPDYPVHFDTKSLLSKLFHNTFIFPEGAIFIFSSDQLTAEVAQIYKRFAGVFGQTYRRYLDLQKAEAQAREAQIEAALEKVRGKAMAMYNSADLTLTASMVFTELRKLGIEPMRCGISIQNKENRKNLLYFATASEDGHNLSLAGWAPLEGHPVLTEIHDNWMRGEDYFPVLKGDLLKTYYEKIKSSFVVPAAQAGYEQFGYFLAFSEGTFYGWSEKPFTGPEINILKRFTSVIDLTFRRHIELQKSEASARDAVRAASLDRVRAEIASMRTIADLNRITPLIWNELTILGVPFIRCGVFIMDEAQEVIHTYLSTPNGKAIAAFQLHFSNDSGNGVNGAALRGWREKQMVTLHWTEEEFRNFSHSLKEQGEIISEESYLTERPPTGLDLHFFPFLQGMLYAGNSAPLSDDDKDLVQSLADAFSTAYARYEDFNRLELAKQEVERTLTDLRTAQTRLIQSEKMASLGELTAGIAHEIQNPLNFVNNFSEVNQDLLEELKAESLKPKAERDAQLEIELINDLINNEQKINHHGKRADGIVKGMLQHSRTAGGEKLPTNINSVAEEYMRLSYHGLRAKDKGFNAEMVMNFDPNLPKIMAVGQDIGRVFLNLFNNAFYAVNQKKKTAGADYSPEVFVATSADGNQVIVSVKDNGVGMPQQVKEKIMQPFFTTKPTGEGTGLGLSLTYDMVVKGHGGSIQVNSVEGEGSEFVVSLPLN